MEISLSVIGSPVLRAVGPELADQKWRTERGGFWVLDDAFTRAVLSSSLEFGGQPTLATR